MSALAELSADVELAAGLGHNQPPEPTPYEAIKVHIEDLLIEAHNWADGTVVETQAQADEASRLVDDLQKAAKAAEAIRVEEKTPLDEKINEIQARFNVYIAPPTNKKPGKVFTAIAALKATTKPYLDKVDAELRAAAAKAQEEAAAAAAKAAEAMRAAAQNDLAAREAAEEQVEAARLAAAAANRAANDKAQARGGDRAMGLKRTYTARLDNPHATLLHYWGTSEKPGSGRDQIISYLADLAQADVNHKVHTIPGVVVVEGTRL